MCVRDSNELEIEVATPVSHMYLYARISKGTYSYLTHIQQYLILKCTKQASRPQQLRMHMHGLLMLTPCIHIVQECHIK